MGLYRMLLQLMMLVGLVLSITTLTPATATTELAKPGCPDKCGNVSIPYPFGTKAECYLNEQFLITCNNSANPPKAYLGKGNVNAINISLLPAQLRIMQYIAYDCYAHNGTRERNTNPFIRVSRIYTISDTENKFVAVGCDTYAIIKGKQLNGEIYTTGCMTICNNISYVNESCSGTGCCQVSIPKGVRNISTTLASYNNHRKIWDFNPCSYAFVVEEKEFHFSQRFLKEIHNKEKLQMMLDWAIGNETCKVAAKNKTSYACKENSTCYENNNGVCYRCKCLEGFEGNPYLHGCHDIDECKDSSLNQCKEQSYCVNTAGSYNCSCPKDYFGDGKRNGTGCIAIATRSHWIQVALGVGMSIIVLLVGGSWLYFGLKRRKLIKLKEKFFQQNGGLMLQQQLSGREISKASTKIFSAEELKKATDNYDEPRIIGREGFGTVYKGVLGDNSTVAIKKSKVVDRSQIEQFINEVVVLSQINHRNVVRLLGCCLETEVPLLVYEFVTNGTLFDHIHDKSKASTMSCEIRLRIATETAGVLSYLHSAASTPIIHRDVKTTNILLDDNYTAKVSDFGASRLVPIDQTQLSTMVQGTLGYLDPEYLHTSQLTDKSDVYSFGVVLVELITGKKALSFDRPEEERSLAKYFLSSLKENSLFQVIENCIVNEGNVEQLKEVAKIAKNCLSVKGEARPTMKEVAMELEGLRMMEKQMCISVELNLQGTEYIPGESSDNYSIGGSGNTTVGYDSMKNQIILPDSDGR